jgi:dinuclear metal center YbgI/SA1388 family protein
VFRHLQCAVMQTSAFFELLQSLAPLELAESWDNVGVLVDRGAFPDVNRVLLTIDLTWDVYQEAMSHDVQAIVAYHPPIFSGLKRITPQDPQGRLLGEVLGRGLVIYSPHTALDAVPHGVNDWLVDAFDVVSRRPVAPSVITTDVGLDAASLSLSAPGQGRFVELRSPISLDVAVDTVKRHLGLSWVRVSRGIGLTPAQLRTVAVCAGAGGGLLSKVHADLLITGEMRHHDVLGFQQRGVSVILTDHTNSERGYLPVLRARLLERAPTLEVYVSAVDQDPLRVV